MSSLFTNNVRQALTPILEQRWETLTPQRQEEIRLAYQEIHESAENFRQHIRDERFAVLATLNQPFTC
jgi:hypothetical protein